jgi:HEAT repeat protein
MRPSKVLALALVATVAMGSAAAGEDETKAPAKAPAADAKKDAPAATEPRTEEQLAALRAKILGGLLDPKPQVRSAAADAIVFAWPDSAAILDAALASTDAGVRFEATVLLRRPELGDMRARIRPRLSDTDMRVRMHAVRAARHLKWPEIEPEFIRIVAGDPSFLVIQETLRGLEEIGTIACAQVVFRGWTTDVNEDHHRRYKRVLVKVIGADHGEDVEKWRTAIEKAETEARARKPAAKQPAPKRSPDAPPAEKNDKK